MNHTPEDWVVGNLGMVYSADLVTAIADLQVEPDSKITLEQMNANAERIVACVNGCAGLNPAAYRSVVEALKDLLPMAEALHEVPPIRANRAKQALALAEQP